MDSSKWPYQHHILRNLFHEQVREIIPLLLPQYQVEQILEIEMPELRSIPMEKPYDPMTQIKEGLAGLVLPGAEVTGVYRTEWIEHSGRFEHAYKVKDAQGDKPLYLSIEFQVEPQDVEDLPRRLMVKFVQADLYVSENFPEEDENEQESNAEEEQKAESRGTSRITYVYPMALCPFPGAAPKAIREEFFGKPLHVFNFKVVALWEKDAREFLNMHSYAVYFLLPVMKNADASLLGLAIDGLAQHFKNDQKELGRHLTGLNLLLKQSEGMSEEEKLATQEHLKPFAHLLKDDPDEQ